MDEIVGVGSATPTLLMTVRFEIVQSRGEAGTTYSQNCGVPGSHRHLFQLIPLRLVDQHIQGRDA